MSRKAVYVRSHKMLTTNVTIVLQQQGKCLTLFLFFVRDVRRFLVQWCNGHTCSHLHIIFYVCTNSTCRRNLFMYILYIVYNFISSQLWKWAEFLLNELMMVHVLLLLFQKDNIGIWVFGDIIQATWCPNTNQIYKLCSLLVWYVWRAKSTLECIFMM